MKISIICRLSKKGNLYYALVINDIMVCFDVPTISRATGVAIRDIYLLNVDENIDF